MTSLANEIYTLVTITVQEQVSAMGYQSKVAVNEVLNCVTNLNIHVKTCSGKVK